MGAKAFEEQNRRVLGLDDRAAPGLEQPNRFLDLVGLWDESDKEEFANLKVRVKCHLDSHLTGRGHSSALHPAVRGHIFPSALSSPVRPCAITTVAMKRARLAGLRAAAQHAGRAHAPRAGGAALRAGSAPVPTRSPQRPGPACYGIDDVFDRCHATRGSLIGGAGGGGGARQARARRPCAPPAPARDRL